MDQNSNMGGFSPAQGNASGVNGFQTAPAGNAPLPNVNPFGSVAPAPAPTAAPNPTMPPVAQNPQNINFNPEPKKNKTLIETLVLIGVCLIAAVAIIFAVYFFIQYNDLKRDFESQKNEAVMNAVKQTQDEDNAAFKEQEKLPYYSFTGPSDYGTISFNYPKTWNMFIEDDGSKGGQYSVYFAPKQIYAPSNQDARYALRFKILNQQITNVQQTYDSMAKAGTLSSRVFTADNSKLTGMRYEGELQQNMRGIVIIAKVNDKTVLLQMDAEAYRKDFEEVVKSLKRNS